MTAPLSEAAAKLRKEVFDAINKMSWYYILDVIERWEDPADAAIAALGITWEQAAKLKSGAKIVEVVDLPQPPINMEPSP